MEGVFPRSDIPDKCIHSLEKEKWSSHWQRETGLLCEIVLECLPAWLMWEVIVSWYIMSPPISSSPNNGLGSLRPKPGPFNGRIGSESAGLHPSFSSVDKLWWDFHPSTQLCNNLPSFHLPICPSIYSHTQPSYPVLPDQFVKLGHPVHSHLDKMDFTFHSKDSKSPGLPRIFMFPGGLICPHLCLQDPASF